MKLNSILMIFFILNNLFLISCSKSPSDKGFEILPDMIHSVPYEAYSENSVTKDGKSMLNPPLHSISRQFKPYPYDRTEADAIRANEELQNPISFNEQVLDEGKKHYENFCLVCHGKNGKGDGPLIPKFPNPPSFTIKRLLDLKDGHFFHVMTVGLGDMPSHAVQITEQDRWKVVHYIRTLQKIK